MSRGLSRHVRSAWDALIESEGAALGLSGCHAFLENKLVNDIFYEGAFKGEPCIVKCSSRAPESIENEYKMSRRLNAVAPVCAEALALWRAPDGRRAFVVTRRLPGPSLAGMLARDVGEEEAVGVLEDMIRIAEALIKSGIVWRDIIPDNFMRDSDGHLKLIDAQFAIDRNDFREDPFLLKNWGYRMLTFAHHPMTAGYGWNDAAMMLFYTWKLSGSARAQELCDRLRTMSDASNFTVEYGGMDRFRMRIALAVLRMQRAIAGLRGGSAALDTRIARAEAFLKRDCGLWKKVLGIKT